MREHELFKGNRLPPAALYGRDVLLPVLGGGLALLLLGYFLCIQYISSITPRSFQRYVLMVSWAFAAVCLLLILLRRPGQPELWLLAVNWGWAVFTRALLGDLVWNMDGTCYWYMLFACFFTIGFLSNKKQRAILLDAATVLLGGITLIWAVTAFFSVLNGRVLKELPQFFRWGIHLDIGDKKQPWLYVRLFGFHRNITAAYFLTSICLMLYQCFHRRSLVLRLLAALAILPLYLVIALQHSRSVYLSTAVCLGLSAGFLSIRKLKAGLPARIAVAAAVTLAVTAALYVSFSPCSNLIFKNAAPPQKTFLSRDAREVLLNTQAKPDEAEAKSDKTETAAKSAAISEKNVDSRSTLRDARTLTYRTGIWATVVPALREQPRIAWIGQPEETIPEVVSRFTGRNEKLHMHNVLVQQFMLTGMPGFLIYAVFLALLLIRLLRCYFRPGIAGNESDVILGIGLTSLMVYGIFEVLLNYNTCYVSFLFCLMAGCFVGGTKGALKIDR